MHCSEDKSHLFLPKSIVVVWVEKRDSISEDDSIVYSQCIILFFESFLCFWELFPIAAFDSFHHVMEKSVCSRFSFHFCLGHQIILSEVYVFDWKHTPSLWDSSSSKSLQLKASAWDICSPGKYFNSKSKPIGAIAHLMILADAVFVISSSGGKRYLSGLGSVCRLIVSKKKFCQPCDQKDNCRCFTLYVWVVSAGANFLET